MLHCHNYSNNGFVIILIFYRPREKHVIIYTFIYWAQTVHILQKAQNMFPGKLLHAYDIRLLLKKKSKQMNL